MTLPNGRAPEARPQSTAPETLLDALSRYFDIVLADTPERLRCAHEIRYEVYCLERGFESRDEHPDGLETDEFDPRGVHSLLVHRPSGEAIGTVRLVLPDPRALERSFAIQRVVDAPLLRDPEAFPVVSMGEISRFSISKKFRRRADDTFYGPDPTAPESGRRDERRVTPPMRLGLMQAIVRMSALYGLTHWCAVMEPTLLRILSASAIHFEAIGPLVDYHGRRQPCYADIATVLTHLERNQRAVWDVVTDRGALWDLLRQAWRVSQRERMSVNA